MLEEILDLLRNQQRELTRPRPRLTPRSPEEIEVLTFDVPFRVNNRETIIETYRRIVKSLMVGSSITLFKGENGDTFHVQFEQPVSARQVEEAFDQGEAETHWSPGE